MPVILPTAGLLRRRRCLGSGPPCATAEFSGSPPCPASAGFPRARSPAPTPTGGSRRGAGSDRATLSSTKLPPNRVSASRNCAGFKLAMWANGFLPVERELELTLELLVQRLEGDGFVNGETIGPNGSPYVWRATPAARLIDAEDLAGIRKDIRVSRKIRDPLHGKTIVPSSFPGRCFDRDPADETYADHGLDHSGPLLAVKM